MTVIEAGDERQRSGSVRETEEFLQAVQPRFEGREHRVAQRRRAPTSGPLVAQ
jgi:hypothetical protein